MTESQIITLHLFELKLKKNIFIIPEPKFKTKKNRKP